MTVFSAGAQRLMVVGLLLLGVIAQAAGATTVTDVTSAKANGTYGVGTVIDITVSFDAIVTVDTTGGVPALQLETGTTDSDAVYVSGSGSASVIFRYTVAAGDASADLTYLATNALVTNGGSIKTTGVDADLTLPGPFSAGSLWDNKDIVIDTVAPVVQSVTSSSANTSYGIGAVIPIQVVFSKSVTVTGSLTLLLSTGSATPVNYTSGSGTTTLTFDYTVVAGHSSPDLGYSSTTALSLASASSLRDVGGNNAVLTLPATGSGFALIDMKNLIIDGIAPTVSVVTGTDGTYGVGAVVGIGVVFSETVTVVGTPTLSLATPGVRIVNYASGPPSTTLAFPYTVVFGDNTADLDYSATNALALNGATIRDAAGNDAVLTLPPLASGSSLAGTSAVVVDTIRPTVAFVRCGAPNGIYGAGASLTIEVHFTKAMAVTGSPRLELATGGTTSVAFGSVVSSTVLTFPYTVAALDSSADLDYTSTAALTLNSGTIADTLGNPAILQLPAVGSALSLAGTSSLVIDTTLRAMSISSTAADGVYGLNSPAIPIAVTFSEAVTVTGSPSLTLNSGGIATYASGSPGTVLTFSYAIGSSQGTNDLNVTAIALNGGSIKNASSADANLVVPVNLEPGSLSANKNIGIETTAATIVSVTSASLDGSYRAGQTLPISVVFSEPVFLSQISPGPTLALQTGSAAPTVLPYVSGSGSTTLTFNYVISTGQAASDLDYFSTAAFSLNGGTIRDLATNNAAISLPALGAAGSLSATKNLVIDTAAPFVSVVGVTSTLADSTYGIGQVIPISVAFNEPVVVTGAPRLHLAVTTPNTFATYASGSGSATLIFNYIVALGNASADLDYTDPAALGLNGGTITDVAQNPANLTLANPGTSGSLATNKSLAIDASQPVVTGVTSSPSFGTFKTGGVISIRVTFDKPVFVVGGTPKLTLETGASDAVVDYSSGSGTSVLTFVYTVAAGHISGDLDYLSSAALANGGATVRDAPGNNAILTLPSVGTSGSLAGSSSVIVDAQRPTIVSVSSTLPDGIYSTTTAVPITITFSEPVVVTAGAATLKMETGVNDTVATYTAVPGTFTVLTFTYTVAAGDAALDLDYFSSSALVLTTTTMKDAAGNDLDTFLATPGSPGSLSSAKDIRIDTAIPSVAFVDSSAANGAYRSGTLDISVHFSEPVNVGGSGTLTLKLETGGTDQTASYASGSGTDILHFSYAIVNGDQSTDLDYFSTTALVAAGGTTIRDLAGIDATLTLPALAGADSLAGRKSLIIDTAAPVVSSAAGVSGNGSYGVGRSVTVKVVFSENVIVTGTPALVLAVSPTPVVASYQSGSGTKELTFSFDVAAGESAADLDYASTTALSAGGGSTITDLAGNPAVLTLPAPGTTGSIAAIAAIVIDTVIPVVIDVDSTKPNGIYGVGVVIPVRVKFSKAVVVTGAPSIQLETGVTDTTVPYTSGSGSTSLIFTYTVAAGHDSSDLDYFAASLAANTGTIKDLAGNTANLTLPAPGAAGSLAANSTIVVNTATDSSAPTVVSVTSPATAPFYVDGNVIDVDVTMSEPVTVVGTPFLILNSIGSSHTTPTATYFSGSGTSTLTFKYTVLAGHFTTDLDYTNSGAFRLGTGGQIADVANNAVLTLPAAGGANSLGGSKDIAINPGSGTGGKPPAGTVAIPNAGGGGCGLGSGMALLGMALTAALRAFLARRTSAP
jgi:hypothetical protein